MIQVPPDPRVTATPANVAPPQPTDQQQIAEEQQQPSIIEQIDMDDLSSYIMNTLRDDIRDREEFQWDEKRRYDLNAYEGQKKPTDFPWKNASNFPVPLTSTLVDTAHANIVGSIFADAEKIVGVKGVAKEDIRTAPFLADLLNWQLVNDIATFETMDATVMRSFKSGTGIVKVIQDPQEKKVVIEDVPVENMYVPIEAKGFQIWQKCNHAFQLIALTAGDIEERKAQGFYEGLEDLKPGFRIVHDTSTETLMQTRDKAAGTSLSSRHRRDMYYIIECYLTYWFRPKGAEPSTPKQSVELVVWIGGNGGKVLNAVENILRDPNGYAIRPFARFCPYPYEDRFYGRSLPEKIRFIQEELDYAHNQNINAADIAISPPTFYSPAGDLNPELNQLVPGGFYPTPTPRDVFVAERRVDPVFERQEDKYWDLAERLTGLTELFQGREPSRTATLGEAVLRNNRSEIRFATLYKRFERGFKEMVYLIYFYDQRFLPEETKVKVTGTAEIQTVKELFPDGLQGKYDFYYCSEPLTEKEKQKQLDMEYYTNAMLNPVVATNVGNLYKHLKLLADATNHKNLDLLCTKPSEAYVLSPEEAIQRIASGEYDVAPDPNIDAERYVFKIQLYMKTDAFTRADQMTQLAIGLLLRRSEMIRQGQIMARMIKTKAASQGSPPPAPEEGEAVQSETVGGVQ